MSTVRSCLMSLRQTRGKFIHAARPCFGQGFPDVVCGVGARRKSRLGFGDSINEMQAPIPRARESFWYCPTSWASNLPKPQKKGRASTSHVIPSDPWRHLSKPAEFILTLFQASQTRKTCSRDSIPKLAKTILRQQC